MKVLDKGRLHIGAYSVGVAERMLNDALHYAIERKQFGQPIANFQLIQAMLADSKAEIYAAKCMVLMQPVAVIMEKTLVRKPLAQNVCDRNVWPRC